jgi:hypothetical protein
MAVSASLLAAGTMTTSLSTVYTVPGSTQAVVTYASFHNKTGGSVLVTLVFNHSGDKIILNISLGASETFVFKERPVLETGDLIKVQADTSTAIDYYISGGLIT